MKGLWVPLLVVWLTGNVAAQQDWRQPLTESTSSNTLSSLDDTPLSTMQPFASGTLASGALQDSGTDNGPQPDEDAVDSTMTRQQTPDDQLKRPMAASIDSSKIKDLRDGGALTISLKPSNPNIPLEFVTGLVLGIPPNMDRRDLDYRTIYGKPFGDGVIKFMLSDADIEALQNQKLKYLFPKTDLGKYNSALLVHESTVPSAGTGSSDTTPIAPPSIRTQPAPLSDNSNNNDFVGPTQSPFSRLQGSGDPQPSPLSAPQIRTDGSFGANQTSTTPINDRVASRNTLGNERPSTPFRPAINQTPLAGDYQPPRRDLAQNAQQDQAQRQLAQSQQALAKLQAENARLKQEREQQSFLAQRQSAPLQPTGIGTSPISNPTPQPTPGPAQETQDQALARQALQQNAMMLKTIEDLRNQLSQANYRNSSDRFASNQLEPGPIQPASYRSQSDASTSQRTSAKIEMPAAQLAKNDLPLGNREAGTGVGQVGNGSRSLEGNRPTEANLAKNPSDTKRLSELEDELERTKGQMQMLLFLLAVFIFGTLFFGYLARGFYVRYGELGDELRETFSRSLS